MRGDYLNMKTLQLNNFSKGGQKQFQNHELDIA